MTFDKVKEIISSELGFATDGLELDSTLEDMGADSLDAVELILALEEEFDLEIPESVALDMKSLRNIVDYIEKNK